MEATRSDVNPTGGVLYIAQAMACSILANVLLAHYKSRRIWLWLLIALIPLVGYASTVVLVLLPTRHAARLQEQTAKATLRG